MCSPLAELVIQSGRQQVRLGERPAYAWQMTAVWHGVPRDVIGDALFPLSQLRDLDAGLYESQRAKYAGREEVLDYRLPVLDCGFLETIHCSRSTRTGSTELDATRGSRYLPAPRRGGVSGSRSRSRWSGSW